MGRRTVLLIASILVAAVGTVLVGLYVRSADTRARAQEQQAVIWVAAEPIAAGTSIVQARPRLQQKEYPQRLLPPKAVGNLQEVRSLVIRSDIYRGQPLVTDQLQEAGSSTGTALTGVERGNTLATIAVDQETENLLGTVIRPGSRVAVLATGQGQGSSVLLRDVLVKDIDSQDDAAGDATERMVTLEGAAGALVKAISASKSGEVTLLPLNDGVTLADQPENNTSDSP